VQRRCHDCISVTIVYYHGPSIEAKRRCWKRTNLRRSNVSICGYSTHQEYHGSTNADCQESLRSTKAYASHAGPTQRGNHQIEKG